MAQVLHPDGRTQLLSSHGRHSPAACSQHGASRAQQERCSQAQQGRASSLAAQAAKSGITPIISRRCTTQERDTIG